MRRFFRLFLPALTCLFSFAALSADWFDARIGDYVTWPVAADVPQGGIWKASSADVSLTDLATLSGEAPQAALEVRAEDAALDFQVGEIDFGVGTESIAVSMKLAFNAFSASAIPAVDPEAKAGVILVRDGVDARLYYLAKGLDSNVWVASDFVVSNLSTAQDVAVTLKKTANAVFVTYAVGETIVAQDVEVAVLSSVVSKVCFSGSGCLSALAGTAVTQTAILSIDSSLADIAHLEVVAVRDLDSDRAVESSDGKFLVPYGARLAISFRPVRGYRLAGSDVLEMTAMSAAIVLNAATPGLAAVDELNAFRVTPYVQHPKPNAMTLLWLAQTNGAARVEVWKDGTTDIRALEAVEREDLSADVTGVRFTADDVLQYCRAPELDYVNSVSSGDNYPAYTREKRFAGWSMPYTVPYQYRVRLTGLEADALYHYRVTLDDNGATYENVFRTSPDPTAWRGFKFIYFSDSETEPADNDASSGLTSDWDIPEGSPRTSTTYFATQTDAYAANLRAAVDFGTELIVMAGDLAQTGSRQCDWDEFWRHNAGQLNDPAGSIPIIASPGNHDYANYTDGGNVGISKYLSYFEYEPNQAAVSDRQHELFHRVDYGPVTFLFMDACNGNDDVLLEDTSRELSRRDADGFGNRCLAPDFNPGSEMYNWLEEQLKDAQKNSAFTFVICHQCPYSCGYHGGQIVEKGTSGGDTQTGRALRVLEPLFHKYGVDGWLCGHDEMMERSEIEGIETLPDGTEVPHKFCVWDMGIAGDGLRGNVVYNNVNPQEKYRAHVDCPEVYENGVLVEGGKHYGHLEVTIDQAQDGSWRATFDPVYLFFGNDASGNAVYGGVRHYADKVVRISNRCKGTPPAPQPVTKTHVDISTFVPTKQPQGLLTTFWNGPFSRGFSWQTDTTVAETKLWLLKGEYDQDDGNTFVAQGALIEGTCEAKTAAEDKEPEDIHVHRVHVENLESGATYSYRLGGNGYYVYGRFEVKGSDSRIITAVHFSDTQGTDASLLHKAEKTAALAARTAGDDVDLVLFGGNLVDSGALKNVNHVRYGAMVPNSAQSWECMHWKWGLMTETLASHFQGVPWFMASGNHDYRHCRDMTAVDYYKTGMSHAGCSSIDIGNVHFAELPFLGAYEDSAVIAEYAAAFDWLNTDLQASSARWKVLLVHLGPSAAGNLGVGCEAGDSAAEGSCEMIKALTPILSRNHVDLVLQAHDRVCAESLPCRWGVNSAGTYYVNTGCAGPQAADSQMFGILKVNGDRLAYDFYVAEEDGSVTQIDRFRVIKGITKFGSLLMLK